MPGSSSTNGPRRRVTSMRPCDSILMTSAPRWASCIAANGPAHTHVRSITRSPASGAIGRRRRRTPPGAVPSRRDRRRPPAAGHVEARAAARRRGGGSATPARATATSGARSRSRNDSRTRSCSHASTSAAEWTRHAGTPTACAVVRKSSTVNVARGLGDERLDDVVLLRPLGRRREDLEVPPVGIAEHRDERPPLAVLGALHEHRAVAQRVDPPRAHGAVAAGDGHLAGVRHGRQRTSPSCRPSPRARTRRCAGRARRRGGRAARRGRRSTAWHAANTSVSSPRWRTGVIGPSFGFVEMTDSMALSASAMRSPPGAPASGPVRPNVEMSTTTRPGLARSARSSSASVGRGRGRCG